MYKACTIGIGNELMTGQISDTNAVYLSSKLIAFGIPTVGMYQVGDDIDTIVKVMRQAYEAADIILITGGLGPTDDDLTRQAFAKFLGTQLQLRNDLLESIKVFFNKRGIQMPNCNKIQAYIPAGTEPLENTIGTAPGIIAKYNDRIIVSMPGVPTEMKEMFERTIACEIAKLPVKQAIVIKKLKCFGTGESQLAEMLGNLMDRQRQPPINCTVSSGVITLHIIAAAENKEQAQLIADNDEILLRNILGEYVYGTGEETLAEAVGKELAKQGKKLTLAESCTGGWLAKLITDIPGSSRYFTCGWVVYSNIAKTAELDVAPETIRQYGAVSEEVAAEMAKAARQKASADYAISITGIAGPGGGSEQKPVGLIYIGIADEKNCSVTKHIFPHNRESIRLRAAQTAINLLRLKLQI